MGKSEEQLKAEGIKYRVGSFPMMANSRARTNDDASGVVKVLADAETDRLLGAWIIASGAGEMIAEFGLAIHHEVSVFHRRAS